MVRVVEEEDEAARALAAEADLSHERRLVPLVDEHQIGTVRRRLDVERRRVVEDRPQLRERTTKFAGGAEAVLLEEVAPAPAVVWLEDADLVPARDEVARDAAQE